MYKAKVKWNGDHYFAGEEVKGSKIVIIAAIKNINEIIQSLQPQIQRATKRIYRSPLSKEDSYRLLYYCYKAEVEKRGLVMKNDEHILGAIKDLPETVKKVLYSSGLPFIV